MNRRVVHLALLAMLLLLAAVLYVSMGRSAAGAGLSLEQRKDLVRQWLDLGQTERAESLARQLMREQDNPPSLACLLAQVLLAEHRADEAAALLQPIRDAQAGSEVCEMLGKALLAGDHREAARRELETALSLEPNRMGAIAALGALALDQQQYDEAARLLKPHADEPKLQALLAGLAVGTNDAALLSRDLKPLDAAAVGGVLAMLSDREDWLNRLTPPVGSTPWSLLVEAWRHHPDEQVTQQLLTLVLDRLDDPMLSAQPLKLTCDQPQRLWQLAQQLWPHETMWDDLAPPQEAIACETKSESLSEAALIARVLSDQTPARHWDAALAQLDQRLGAQAVGVLMKQNVRRTPLACAWRAKLALELNNPAEARRWIERAAADRPDSPRVLRLMGELAPTSAKLDALWPGATD